MPGQLQELKDDLEAIRTLPSVSALERIRLRGLQAKIANAGSVCHELMEARDRQQTEAFLDFQYGNHQARTDTTRQWLSADGELLYAITLGDHYSLKGRDSLPLYDSCCRTGLDAGLHAGKPTALKDTRYRVTAACCRNAQGAWLIQLPHR